MFSKKNKQLEEERQNEELSKDNKEKESNRDETDTENKDAVNGKSSREDDRNYKNLMDYFTDYSYYEKALVDKDHDMKNKF